MNLHIWISFVAASIVVLLIPGPTVLQCIADSLANQNRQRWGTVLGVGAGDAIAMTLSLCGAGALLRASATAFTTLRTLGALYLIYLGVRAIWNARKIKDHAYQKPQIDLNFAKPESRIARFLKTSMITVLNPKSTLFFVAFVPQFISTQTAFRPQVTVLLVTFVSLAMLNAWFYMSMANVFSTKLQTPSAQRKAGYASGGVLLTAGGLTLALKRS